ncbi:MAG: hypothetical protein Alpg2KO_04260 [Alphaproteobacteria bacterium]
MIITWFTSRQAKATAKRLYPIVVQTARSRDLYAMAKLPDTVEGRFEALSLVAFAMMERLSRADKPGKDAAQALFDHMFRDLELNLGQIGVGDMSIGKQTKRLASHFMGRCDSYRRALGKGRPAVLKVLEDHLFDPHDDQRPDTQAITAIADWLADLVLALDAMEDKPLLTGQPDLPQFVGTTYMTEQQQADTEGSDA